MGVTVSQRNVIHADRQVGAARGSLSAALGPDSQPFPGQAEQPVNSRARTTGAEGAGGAAFWGPGRA